ncbi:MAG: hypothetical protein ACJ0F4_01900 [Gammaproteobacteria bacterium]
MHNTYKHKKLFQNFSKAFQFAKQQAQLSNNKVFVKRSSNKINPSVEVSWESNKPNRYNLPENFKDPVDMAGEWIEKTIPEAGTFNIRSEGQLSYLLKEDTYDINKDDWDANDWEHIFSPNF